jgi:hypothetical protein
MSEFGTLTPRMAAYRERMLSTLPRVCAERAVLATQSERAHSADPLAVRRARMLETRRPPTGRHPCSRSTPSTG